MRLCGDNGYYRPRYSTEQRAPGGGCRGNVRSDHILVKRQREGRVAMRSTGGNRGAPCKHTPVDEFVLCRTLAKVDVNIGESIRLKVGGLKKRGGGHCFLFKKE